MKTLMLVQSLLRSKVEEDEQGSQRREVVVDGIGLKFHPFSISRAVELVQEPSDAGEHEEECCCNEIAPVEVPSSLPLEEIKEEKRSVQDQDDAADCDEGRSCELVKTEKYERNGQEDPDEEEMGAEASIEDEEGHSFRLEHSPSVLLEGVEPGEHRVELVEHEATGEKGYGICSSDVDLQPNVAVASMDEDVGSTVEEVGKPKSEGEGREASQAIRGVDVGGIGRALSLEVLHSIEEEVVDGAMEYNESNQKEREAADCI